MSSFPFYKQLYEKDCGPTCLKIIAKYYGKTLSVQQIRELSNSSRAGANLIGLSDAAEAMGFKTLSVKIPFEQFRDQVPLPCVVYWKKKHFFVVYKFTKKHVYVSDPAYGLVKYTHEEFKNGWLNTQTNNLPTGILLAIEPTPIFYTTPEDKIKKTNWSFLISYLKPYKKYIVQLFLGMLIGSLLMLIFPFLTQAIFDVGITNNNPGFINLILIAQLALTFGRTSVDFIRSWILFHMSSRLNLFILSDFLIKLMKLPISFFDTKLLGDILQRIGDQKRIETFLSSSSLSFIFSLINLIIFGAVLIVYNTTIFWVNIIGSFFI